jgi:photosystem II stability/assembly factor-like uncharacterized protein
MTAATTNLGMLIALCALVPLAGHAGKFVDSLDTPAQKTALASSSVMQGVVRAGKRLVAVGERGHIVFSDDGGGRWLQSEVPVAADLTAVHFPTAEQGWAVGHGGVVLHSRDGGRHWVKQLDGRQAADLAFAYYRDRAQNEQGARALEQARWLVAEGADKPFLDVWFDNERVGYIVGAFNLIFKTDDGGQSWEPWLHRIDNPGGLHLYAIRGSGAGLYIAGEQGLVLRLDAAGRRFVSVATPYKGSYFGLLVKSDMLLVYGLRGNAYRSVDGGRRWIRSDTGISSGITGGAALDDGRLVLVSQSGQVLVSRDEGASFAPLAVDPPLPFHGVTPAGSNAIALAGMGGVHSVRLEPIRRAATLNHQSGR